MPSGHRSSPSSGRKTESAEDANSKLRAQLSDVTTKLNQAWEDIEKYKAQLAQTKRRSSISVNHHGASVHELKEQVIDLQRQNDESEDEVEQWKEHYKALERKHGAIYENLQHEIRDLQTENTRLRNDNDKLHEQNQSLNTAYTQLSSTLNAKTSKLPERPKERPPKEYYPEAGRSRDSDRKREKEEAKSKKRLSERFEVDRGRGSGSGRDRERPPTTSSNKPKRRESMSYHEPFGSATPARTPSRSRQVPRNAANIDPLRSPIYSSGSGGSAVDDVEDGNYHAYPVTPSR